ncbi:MAG: hypothetical protein HDS10_01290 [Bacteroides sp.]|nr:hypothetical protein [Bacteroides sp.]
MKIWTKDEEECLKRIYNTMPTARIAQHFGKTVFAVRAKCYRLGLKRGYDQVRIKVSDQDRLWLRLNYPHMRTELCALRLGISARSCVRLARDMGLRKTPQFMKECQALAARKAKESHLRNGTYPQKGVYTANLQKGRAYQFKPKILHHDDTAIES